MFIVFFGCSGPWQSNVELVSVAITPGNPTVTVGAMQPLVATGTYSDQSMLDITAEVSWAVTDATVISVSKTGVLTALAAGTSDVSATLNGVRSKITVTASPASLVSIAITPANPSISKGTSQAFVATGTYSDGKTANLTEQVTWATENPAVATITARGVASGVAVGSTAVSASYSGQTANTQLTVTAAALVSLAVTPMNPSLGKGASQALTATGTFSDQSTQDLTAQVSWSSTDMAVATISNAMGSQGLAMAVGIGTTTLSATLMGKSGSTKLTVTAPTLTAIRVTPAMPSIVKGTTQQLTATGTYTDLSTQDITAQVTWSASDASVATVSNAMGSQGRATGVGLGSATISAALMGKSGSTVLTVTSPVLTAVSVTPSSPSLGKGATQAFIATATYSDLTTQNVTAMASWSSTDMAVATISNAMGSQGLAAAVALGTTTISATYMGKSGTTLLTVTAPTLTAISVTPAMPAIAKGTTQQFTATGTYTDLSTQDITAQVTWSTADASVATISNAMGSQGLATGAGVGSTGISASLMGKSGSATLSVTMAVLTAIAISPMNPSIAKDTTVQLTATGTYSDGTTQDLTTMATWSAMNPAIATVSSGGGTAGLASGVGAGSTAIAAAFSGKTGSTSLTITSATLVSLTVLPRAPSILTGKSQQFTATGSFSDSTTQDLTTLASWSSSVTGVATISSAPGSAGLASARAAGSTTITASVLGASDSTSLTVTAPTLIGIVVSPSAPTITRGMTQQFTAMGSYSDGSSQNLTTLVTWFSSDSFVATISNSAGSQGRATGVDVGMTTITASYGGRSDSATLTVRAPSLLSISVSPNFMSIAKGRTQQFTATATFSDGSTSNVTSMVSWSAAPSSVATISNSAGSQGRATGVGTGTAIITASGGGKTDSATLVVF
ncbi:ATP-dependent DNA ligase [Haliangium sp. UPWRP_2]|nr:ATP-dependent DNA ligase [Haliangium sp. UPWRP_2]